MFATGYCCGESGVKRELCDFAISIGTAYLAIEEFRGAALSVPSLILYIVLCWWRIRIPKEYTLHDCRRHCQEGDNFVLGAGLQQTNFTCEENVVKKAPCAEWCFIFWNNSAFFWEKILRFCDKEKGLLDSWEVGHIYRQNHWCGVG